MKAIKTLFLAAAVALAASACSTAEGNKGARDTKTAAGRGDANRTPPPHAAGHNQSAAGGAHAADDGHGHDHSADKGRVPAFEADPKKLPPTLSPAMFTGMTRQAYQAVREIPETIAQLPCYCFCDRGFGHKSLHSCFVDTHAAGCAVCVEEAIAAYRLEKEEKLKPEQIRERIIAEYSKYQ